MQVLTKKQFLSHQDKYFSLIKKGKLFIYPTDTIYGIGCDATNTSAVRAIHALKQREKKPFSVIVPSKDWILKHCLVSFSVKKWLGKLPGKYTFILRLKNKKAVSPAVHLGDYTLGVRIPKHWMRHMITAFGTPVVTTSVNITGKPFMTSVRDIPASFKKKIAFVIYEGTKKAHPSTLVDFNSGTAKVKKRKK